MRVFSAVLFIATMAVACGDQLVLTDYISRNDTKAGQEASRVEPFLDNIESYSGLFLVNETTKSHIFFWYFPAEENVQTAPLLLFLNGFPSPSTYGIFQLNGPYTYKNGTLGRRDIYWSKYFNVLYIDNPVGMGYSFSDANDAYEDVMDSIGVNLLSAITQFLQIFPDSNKNGFYISGISYAGKYTVLLWNSMKEANTMLNFKGLFIQNPIIDPHLQFKYGAFLYQWGLITEPDLQVFNKVEQHIAEAVDNNNIQQFYENAQYLGYFSANMTNSYLYNVSGPIDLYGNFRNLPPDEFLDFLSKPEIQSALHVSNTTPQTDERIITALLKTFLYSVKDIYEGMLKESQVAIITGQADLVVVYPQLQKVVNSFKWYGQESFVATQRIPIVRNDFVTGYSKSYENLTFIMLRNCAHETVADNPQEVLNILMSFVNKTSN